MNTQHRNIMIKQLTQLEHKIGDRVFHFVCDPNSPITEVKDALLQFIKLACQVEDQIKANQAAQAPIVEGDTPTADHSVNIEPQPAE